MRTSLEYALACYVFVGRCIWLALVTVKILEWIWSKAIVLAQGGLKVVKATVDTAPVRFDLKTLEGAFVTIRRMSWGEKLFRQENATKQAAIITGGKVEKLDIAILSRKVNEWEFAHLIVDHNLEIDDEIKFDFKRPGQFDKLDPKVGDEIAGYIGDLNNYEEEDQKGN